MVLIDPACLPPPPFYCHSLGCLRTTKTNLSPLPFSRRTVSEEFRCISLLNFRPLVNLKFSSLNSLFLTPFSSHLHLSPSRFARILARHSGIFFPSWISSSWELFEIPTSIWAKREERGRKRGRRDTAKRRPSSQKPVNFLHGYYRWNGWNKLTFFRSVTTLLEEGTRIYAQSR